MKALDLYCGAGGSSVGLHRAGFDVYGVDHILHLDYPFLNKFLLEDVRFLSTNGMKAADLIWASPPCQAYCWSVWNKRKDYPDLVSCTRDLLIRSGKPYVIENVPLAPIRKDLLLCGEMFGLGVIRHRVFEIHGFSVRQPDHIKHRGAVKKGYYVSVAGHGGDGKASLSIWQHAMGIDWIKDKKALTQAVPPAYAEYIGKEFIKGQDAPTNQG